MFAASDSPDAQDVQELFSPLGTIVEVPDRLRALVAEGAVGKKAGRGFYTYD